MINLMIYISPTGSFDNPRADLASNDAAPTAKIQIENSLALGWKPEDIMLVTNFPFTYGKVKSLVLDNVKFFDRKPQATKISAIIELFKRGLIEDDELYWFHDLDAFQLEVIRPSEIDLKQDEIALTDFGGAKKFMGEDRFSTGIIYFKSGSLDIFKKMEKVYYDRKCDEEEALGILINKDKKIRSRVKKINNSYNFIGYNLEHIYNISIKPIKVIHFHPLTGKRRLATDNSLRFFSGDNDLHVPLITEQLLKLFRYHRIR